MALIGFLASFSGGFFDKGFASTGVNSDRNHYKETLANLKHQAPNLKNIKFECKNYTEINPLSYNNCVFYLDPPYRDTVKYSKQSIDYDEFYHFCKELSENNIVLISEYNMPDDFVCIWQKETTVSMDSKRTNGKSVVEKLFMLKDNKYKILNNRTFKLF